MYRTLQNGLSAAVLLILSSVAVLAQNSNLVKKIYVNFDNSGPGQPRPLSDAAQAQFAADASLLGSLQTDNFENLPITSSTTLNPSPDLSINFVGQYLNQSTVNSIGSKGTGYNTTPGGSKFLSVFPAAFRGGSEDVLFNFTSPVQAFGSYFTGLEKSFATETIEFVGGTSQTFVLDGSTTGGGVTFFGFTAISPSVSQIDIHLANTSAGRDLFGIDDLQYVTVSPTSVPEPGTAPFLVGLSVSGIALIVRRKRAHK